jgi:hypothetical protein
LWKIRTGTLYRVLLLTKNNKFYLTKKIIMKKILTGLIVCLYLMSANTANAQQDSTTERHAICGTKAPDTHWEEGFQQQIKEFRSNPSRTGNAVITIPVVVHVLYKTGQAIGKTPNITAAQVKSQIDFLNEMMAGTDPNKSKLPSAFKNVDGGNTNIQFCLALRDANGNTLAEPGIDRIDLTKKGWSDPSTFTTLDQITNLFDNTVKPATIWDPNKFFNMWTGDFTTKSYYLGYATFPSGTGLTGLSGVSLATPKTDGVVMGSNVFGCKALYANGYYFTEPYIYGVTSAHEVGHWLGLRHISGDSQCGNDYCSDTPAQYGGNNNCGGGLNWGCPTYPFQANKCGSTPNGEMFQNYMDYSDDQCRSLFTKEQVIRIQTTMANGDRRKTLGTHGLCDISNGINDEKYAGEAIQVYPNPSQGELAITLPASGKNVVVFIYNLVGERIYRNEVTNSQLLNVNLADQPNGMYFVTVKSADLTTTRKFVLSK